MLDQLINLIDKYGICVDVDVQRSISQVTNECYSGESAHRVVLFIVPQGPSIKDVRKI